MSTCRSRSGRVRRKHSWDKDGRCVFCDGINQVVPLDKLPPKLREERVLKQRMREAELKAAERAGREAAAANRRDSQQVKRTPRKKFQYTQQDHELLRRLSDGSEGRDE